MKKIYILDVVILSKAKDLKTQILHFVQNDNTNEENLYKYSVGCQNDY